MEVDNDLRVVDEPRNARGVKGARGCDETMPALRDAFDLESVVAQRLDGFPDAIARDTQLLGDMRA